MSVWLMLAVLISSHIAAGCAGYALCTLVDLVHAEREYREAAEDDRGAS